MAQPHSADVELKDGKVSGRVTFFANEAEAAAFRDVHGTAYVRVNGPRVTVEFSAEGAEPEEEKPAEDKPKKGKK